MGKGSRSQKLCLGILKDLIKRNKRMKTSSKKSFLAQVMIFKKNRDNFLAQKVHDIFGHQT